MQDCPLEIFKSHPHYTTAEIFREPSKLARGFVERNYYKGMHTQAFYEVNIVLSGAATHYIGQSPISAQTGDVFIIPPHIPHGYRGGSGFDVYHFLLSPTFLEKNAADLQILPAFSSLFRIDPLLREKTASRLHLHLGTQTLIEIQPLLQRITDSSLDRSIVGAITANSEAMILVARLCALYYEQTQSQSNEEDTAFLESVSYLYENFNTNVTLQTLAAIAKMSRTAYINKFKRITGMAPGQLLQQYRITMAERLLSDTDKKIADIAQETGFCDASHLNRLFSAKIGMTPAQYRRCNR